MEEIRYEHVTVDAVTGEVTTVPWTQEEMDVAEALKPSQKREERDVLLETEVDPIASNVLRWNDMTEAKRTEWTNYRQALLDVPAQEGFPNDITWPTKPE
tara:strand:- start:364 stop:663 length:300 start_codon:yes stop_codon:yes gene_type:complete